MKREGGCKGAVSIMDQKTSGPFRAGFGCSMLIPSSTTNLFHLNGECLSAQPSTTRFLDRAALASSSGASIPHMLIFSGGHVRFRTGRRRSSHGV